MVATEMIRPPECAGCMLNPDSPTYNGNVGDYVPPVGRPKAKLLIVGMVPGGHEEELDRPLVGPAGRHLWAVLRKHIAYDDCRITNIVNCRTTKPGLSRQRVNREPTADEAKACIKRVTEPFVCASRPKVTLLLGGFVEQYAVRGAYGDFSRKAVGHHLEGLDAQKIARTLENL